MAIRPTRKARNRRWPALSACAACCAAISRRPSHWPEDFFETMQAEARAVAGVDAAVALTPKRQFQSAPAARATSWLVRSGDVDFRARSIFGLNGYRAFELGDQTGDDIDSTPWLRGEYDG